MNITPLRFSAIHYFSIPELVKPTDDTKVSLTQLLRDPTAQAFGVDGRQLLQTSFPMTYGTLPDKGSLIKTLLGVLKNAGRSLDYAQLEEKLRSCLPMRALLVVTNKPRSNTDPDLRRKFLHRHVTSSISGFCHIVGPQ